MFSRGLNQAIFAELEAADDIYDCRFCVVDRAGLANGY
jgi:hypothetical protein